MENLKNKIREKFTTLGWVKDEVLDYWTHDQEVMRTTDTTTRGKGSRITEV